LNAETRLSFHIVWGDRSASAIAHAVDASDDGITAGFFNQRNGVSEIRLQGSNPEPLMSALGQKQT
jgi:hypothetical protein